MSGRGRPNPLSLVGIRVMGAFICPGLQLWGQLFFVRMDHTEKDHPSKALPRNRFLETTLSFGLAYRAIRSFHDRLCPNRYGHAVPVRYLPGGNRVVFHLG